MHHCTPHNIEPTKIQIQIGETVQKEEVKINEKFKMKSCVEMYGESDLFVLHLQMLMFVYNASV